jgi:trehalose synthase-fused probable maltokinase
VVDVLGGAARGPLRDFLVRQRWFAAKTRGLQTVAIEDWAVLDADRPVLLLLLRLDGERYYVPVSVCAADRAAPADLIVGTGDRAVVDAHEDPAFVLPLLETMAAHRELRGRHGRFVCRSPKPADTTSHQPTVPRALVRITGEQSNTSVIVDRAVILKSIRRPQPGVNPDVEILDFVARRTGFRHVPPLAGWIDYLDAQENRATVAVLQGFVENAGDGWRYALAGLDALCESLESPPGPGPSPPSEARIATLAAPLIGDVKRLGVVTGGLHAALASDPHEPAFRPEPVTYEDVGRWCARIARELEEVAFDTRAAGAVSPPGLDMIREALRGSGGRIDSAVAEVGLLGSAHTHKSRCHGDFHLGQVLKTVDGFVVLDFEGEPARSLEERVSKHPPVRDVAGMLRSLSYAVHTAAGRRPPEKRAETLRSLAAWERHARRAFFEGYKAAIRDSAVRLAPASSEELARVCAVFELEKACYELRYELDNRPDWAPIPADGILQLLESTRR